MICLDKLFVIRYLRDILGIIRVVATSGMYVLICKYGIVCVSFFAHLLPPQRPAVSLTLYLSAAAANLVNGKQIYMSDAAMRGKLPPSSSRKGSQTG